MNRIQAVLAVLFVAGVLMAGPANADTKIVMHAIPHDQRVHCYMPEENGYRDPVTDTVVQAAADSDVDVFLYLVGYDSAAGAGFQLVWPGDWEYFGWSADCLGHQITITDFGDHLIHIGTVFDAVSGGALLPLGYASFTTSGSGDVHLEGSEMCLSGGICYLNEAGDELQLDTDSIGIVAVGNGGYNPSAALPVRSATWGAIKAQYQ